MNFFDPDRPQMGGKPCFLSGKAVIQALQMLPVSETRTEVSIMLPVVDSGSAFSATWFRTKIKTSRIQDVIYDYIDDPELTLEELFEEAKGFMKPDIRKRRALQQPEKPKRVRLEAEPEAKPVAAPTNSLFKSKRVRL